MIDSYFRKSFQKIAIDPALKTPISKLHPIVVTTFGLVFGLIGSGLVYFGMPKIACILILLSGFMDVLDGSIARLKKMVSNMGAALDLIFDRIVEFAIICALFCIDPVNRGIVCLLILGSIYLCVSSFFIVSMFSNKKSEKSFYYSPGIIERTEAFFFFLLLILMPSHFYSIGILFAILVGVTSFWRLAQFCRHEVTNLSCEKNSRN